MKKYFFLIALTSVLTLGCDNEEESVICSCSQDVDVYFYTDSLLTEGVAVPNAFSPNYDGVNDLFYVYGTGISSLSVVVKDGSTIVFQTINQNNGWDGTVNGNVPACQTFDYVVDAVLSSGTTKHFEGTVTIYTSTPCPDNLMNCVFPNTFDGSGFNPSFTNGETFNC